MHARLLTIWPSCPSYKYSHNNIIIMDTVPKLGGKLSNNSKPLMQPFSLRSYMQAESRLAQILHSYMFAIMACRSSCTHQAQ